MVASPDKAVRQSPCRKSSQCDALWSVVRVRDVESGPGMHLEVQHCPTTYCGYQSFRLVPVTQGETDFRNTEFLSFSSCLWRRGISFICIAQSSLCHMHVTLDCPILWSIFQFGAFLTPKIPQWYLSHLIPSVIIYFSKIPSVCLI